MFIRFVDSGGVRNFCSSGLSPPVAPPLFVEC